MVLMHCGSSVHLGEKPYIEKGTLPLPLKSMSMNVSSAGKLIQE